MKRTVLDVMLDIAVITEEIGYPFFLKGTDVTPVLRELAEADDEMYPRLLGTLRTMAKIGAIAKRYAVQ